VRGAASDLRSFVIRVMAPVMEFISIEGNSVTLAFSKTPHLADALCNIRATSERVGLSFTAPHPAPSEFEATQLQDGPDRWLMERACLIAMDRQSRKTLAASRRRREPASGQPEQFDQESRIGVVQVRHEMALDVDCPVCGTPVFRWNLAWHLRGHDGPETHKSVQTISGGGGPGSGKRR
jgi:hypothetical protein